MTLSRRILLRKRNANQISKNSSSSSYGYANQQSHSTSSRREYQGSASSYKQNVTQQSTITSQKSSNFSQVSTQQSTKFNKHSSSSKQSRNNSSSNSSSHFNDFEDDDVFDQRSFIEGFLETHMKDDSGHDVNNNIQSNQETKRNKVVVKAVKGSQSSLDKEKHFDGFQKVTVASGTNRVNHFSRTSSDGSHNNTEDDIKLNDEVSKDIVDEEVIAPTSQTELSGERSFEEIYGDGANDSSYQHAHDNDDNDSVIGHPRAPRFLKDKPIRVNIDVKESEELYDHTDSPPKHKLYEEITYKIPVTSDQEHHEGYHKQQEQHTVKIHHKSPRDNHPDYDDLPMADYEVEQSFVKPDNLHVVTSSGSYRARGLHSPNATLPVNIDVSQYDNNRKIRVVVSPNPQLHQQAGFIPVHHMEMSESEHHHHHEGTVHQPQVIKIHQQGGGPHHHRHHHDQENHQHQHKHQVQQDEIKVYQPHVIKISQHHGDSHSHQHNNNQEHHHGQHQQHVQKNVTYSHNRSGRNNSFDQNQHSHYDYHQQPIYRQLDDHHDVDMKYSESSDHDHHHYQQQHRNHQNQDKMEMDVTDHSHRRRIDSNKENLVHEQYRRQDVQQKQQQQQLNRYQQEHQRRLSSGSKEVQHIKRLRKSSLPNGIVDDGEFRRQTDLQLQRQRDLQQKMMNRQQNESRGVKKIEYSKQQQYHQQKLMQHQQHLQRIQQQQQHRKQQEEQRQQHPHDHVVLNGRVMRRHSFDNSSYKGNQSEDEESCVAAERPQTRERRLSYEQEKSKLEEELQRLQEIEIRKQQTHKHHHHNQHPQQIQSGFVAISNTNYPTSDKTIQQDQVDARRYRKSNSRSAPNTPTMSMERKFQKETSTSTPNPARKRGKIPNSLKAGFQSEDIINDGSKLGERRRSNPNIILGRTDIKTQQQTVVAHHSSTLPRSFGRNNKKQNKNNNKSSTTTKTSAIRRSRSLNNNDSLIQSTSVYDESRLNQAQQRYSKHVDQVFTETKKSKRSEGQKRVNQQPRNKTTQEILAETIQGQRQVTTFDDKSLNIINGSHVKQQEAQQQQQKQQVQKKTSTFQFLFKKPQETVPPPKPRRNQPRKTVQEQEEDIYQSIRVAAKGGVITLMSEKEHEKIEVSDQAKKKLTFSMYGTTDNQQDTRNTHAHHQRQQNILNDGFYRQDVHNTSMSDSCYDSQANTSAEHMVNQETWEGVYYTICTYFFSPEKNDYIQKVHRMGKVCVPKERPHHEKCVFWNHLDNPDREEIVVHKLLTPNSSESHTTIKGMGQNANITPVKKKNMSWVDQAFEEVYDAMDTHTDAGTTFSSVDDTIFDTAFDARSIDSQSTVIAKGGDSDYNISKDYSRYIKHKLNKSTDNA